MKALYLIIGIVLVAAAVVSLATGGFSFTHQKKDVAVGTIQISHQSTKRVTVAPVVSVVALLAAGGMIIAGLRMR